MTEPRLATSRRTRLLMVAGFVLLQLVWVVATPPFGGSDEFDHVYRAAAVARGQWYAEPSDATRGTGALVTVPADLVAAARPACQSLPYTTRDDCLGQRRGSEVVVPSGAGRYHPLFYAVIGYAALPFDGVDALYAMRLATVLIDALLLALALWATACWARTRWPYVAIAVCCTPVLVYSASIAAPNGPEMMAALATWAAGVGLLTPEAAAHRSGLTRAATLAACVLATLRPLGPLWLLLTVLTLLVALRPRRRDVASWARSRGGSLALAVTALVVLQSLLWTWVADALQVSVTDVPASLGHKLAWGLGQVPAWILQSIAAFPLRNDPSSPIVYATYVLLFGAVLGAALRVARGSMLLALIGSVIVSVALPYAIAVHAYTAHFGAWQGRYTLPYAVGIVVLAGLALDRRAHDVDGRALLVGIVLYAVAQTVSPVKMLRDEIRTSPAALLHLWSAPPPVLAAVVAALGASAMWWAAGRSRREPTENL